MSEKKQFVSILMGSKSDEAQIKPAFEVLDYFNISCEVRVLSAHRTPAQSKHYIEDADQRGCAVFIAAAGMAAHLAGFIAAHTIKPVIGVPMDASGLGGIDALLSTVQMPGGIPVATVAIGKAGAKNAGYLAAQILAVAHPALAKKLLDDRQQQATKVLASAVPFGK